MSKNFRKTILYTLFGLFFVIGAGALLFAQGYRFDSESFGVKKVGAVYVRTFPKDAKIFIDGKEQDRNGRVINSGTLVQNLFPKQYKLSVSADGYQPWERTVSINTDLVGEVYAILLPQKNTQVLDFTPDIVAAIPNATFVAKKEDKLYWKNTSIPGVSLIDRSDDSSEVLTKDAKGAYYLTNSNSDQSVLKSQKIVPTLKGKLFFDTESDQFVNYSPAAIGLLALGDKTSQIFKVAANEVIYSADTSKNAVAWAVYNAKFSSTTIYVYDKFSGNAQKVADSLSGENAEIRYSSKNKLGILEKNGDFYVLNSPSDNLNVVATDTQQFAFSQSGNKLAILTAGTLRVLADNTPEIDIQLSKIGAVSKVVWYGDEGHLLLDIGGEVKLLDLLSPKPEDIQSVAPDSAYSYDQSANLLYFAQNGVLWKMEFPK